MRRPTRHSCRSPRTLLLTPSGGGPPSSSRHPLEDFGGSLWRDDRCKVPVVIHVAVQGHDEGLHRLSPPATRGLAPLTLVAVVGGWMGGFPWAHLPTHPEGFRIKRGSGACRRINPLKGGQEEEWVVVTFVVRTLSNQRVKRTICRNYRHCTYYI